MVWTMGRTLVGGSSPSGRANIFIRLGCDLWTSSDEFAKFGKRSTGRANSPGKVRNYVLWFG